MKSEADHLEIAIAAAEGAHLNIDLALQMTAVSGAPLPGDEIRHIASQRVFVVSKRVWSLTPSGRTLLTVVLSELTAQ